MAVNGVEIEVGQMWRNRVGERVKVIHSNNNPAGYPHRIEGEDGRTWTVTNRGRENIDVENALDLLELSPQLVNTAPGLLDKAAAHMRERAATYDSPGGERSMAKTVALFNLHHDAALTEAQGWHFMQILKDVRLFSAKGYHADSAEDGIAYKALMSEAKAKEGV